MPCGKFDDVLQQLGNVVQCPLHKQTHFVLYLHVDRQPVQLHGAVRDVIPQSS